MSINFFQKVNNSFDFAVIFFLLAGSMYFSVYALQSGKFIYILLSGAVYFLSFLVRKILIKAKNNPHFTEAGLFLISPLFVACLLDLLKIDSDIKKYLPDKILLESGTGFIFLIVSSLLSGKKRGAINLAAIFLLIPLVILLNNNQSFINAFLSNNPWIAENIIGFPLIYLFTLLFGLNDLARKNETPGS